MRAFKSEGYPTSPSVGSHGRSTRMLLSKSGARPSVAVGSSRPSFGVDASERRTERTSEYTADPWHDVCCLIEVLYAVKMSCCHAAGRKLREVAANWRNVYEDAVHAHNVHLHHSHFNGSVSKQRHVAKCHLDIRLQWLCQRRPLCCCNGGHCMLPV